MKTIITIILIITLANAQTILDVEIGKEINTKHLLKVQDSVYRTDKLFNGQKLGFVMVKENVNGKVYTISLTTKPKSLADAFGVFKEWAIAMMKIYTVIDDVLDISTWEEYRSGASKLQYRLIADNGTIIYHKVTAEAKKDEYNVTLIYYNSEIANEKIAEYNF